MAKTERKMAAAYIRVSTDDQIEFSPDSQLKKIKEYAKKNDLILPDEFIFMDEGISGRNAAKRPEFNRMISLAKSKPKPFDVILVWKFSRFARNQEESIVYKSMLNKQCGINVISISEPVIEGPFGDLIERIIEWSDEYYSINLAQEVKRGMTEKVSRGGAVSVPAFGYDIVDGVYVPNKDAETVKSIFNDYLSGMGFRAIAIKYTELGVKNRYGNGLDNRFIEYLLRNPVYCGKIRWCTQGRGASKRDYDNPHNLIVDGAHEPIISKDIFDMAQDKIKAQKRKYGKYQRKEQNFDFMVKGLVRCSNCGGTLCYAADGRLQCHNYARGSCKVSHSVSIENINKSVIESMRLSVATLNFNLKVLDEPKAPTMQPDIKKLIEKERAKLERARVAYTEGIDTLEEYKQNKEEINKRIKQLNDRIPKENKVDIKAFSEKVKSVLDIITDDSVSEPLKNDALRSVISDIIYNKKNRSLLLKYYV